MSRDNTTPLIERELEAEYGRYLSSKRNTRIAKFLFKTLVLPLLALLLTVLALANLAPSIYTEIKDNIFEKVDFEKITGQPNSISKAYLDSWLILNSEK